MDFSLNESAAWIEPARLEKAGAEVMDVVADLCAKTVRLGASLHPATAGSLADLVRIMNCSYSSRIEGSDLRACEIEAALQGRLSEHEARRHRQREALAHIRVQAEIDRMHAERRLPEPASGAFLCWLHREMYAGTPASTLRSEGSGKAFVMEPGEWRSRPEHDVQVGRHVPPSSARVGDCMHHFEDRYRFDRMGTAARILAMASAHHRFNYIHPFPDGNGRVSRLMSHAMGLAAGIGGHGLWSLSRGLARGLDRPTDYKRMMNHADMPRQDDLDGQGSLSLRALTDFNLWFLRVCVDQIDFMSGIFDFPALHKRLRAYVDAMDVPPQAWRLVEQALIRGQISRGDVSEILSRSPRQSRRIVGALVDAGLRRWAPRPGRSWRQDGGNKGGKRSCHSPLD